MSRFTNQTVVVTGAAGGIGSVLCDRFAQEGARLVLADLNGEGLTEVAAQLEDRHGVKVVSAVGDLSTRQGAERVTELATSTFGRLDVLVNNAGGGIVRPTLRHTEETLRATIDRNLWSALRCTLTALPVMLDAGYGQSCSSEQTRCGTDSTITPYTTPPRAGYTRSREASRASSARRA
ncbi:MAG: 2,3-dihydroxy-2,3-dihydro-p-cumate dehydrogenase [Pseudonocardiales bacterium]|nr:2,3-dihydroxy-2,3-dihydro-p-cumate dehydrogenase [Pseudonocardiales bacterium]